MKIINWLLSLETIEIKREKRVVETKYSEYSLK